MVRMVVSGRSNAYGHVHTYLPKTTEPPLILVVPVAVFNSTEPGKGETTTIRACFEADVEIPRRCPAQFQFEVSNKTTADQVFEFTFTPSSLSIPVGFSGDFQMCVDWTVMDDDYVEDNEVVIIAVRPLSVIDMVQFPNGTQYLAGTIIDDDGKLD